MDVRPTFHRELDRLTSEVLDMGAMVGASIDAALASLVGRDAVGAAQVIEGDRQIDAAELAIEDHAVALLGTEQPVATDLRRLVTALKIVTQLERMGDHAVHIAKAARSLATDLRPELPPLLPRMGSACVSMLTDALQAFAVAEPRRAMALAAADEAVDAMDDETRRSLVARMRESPELIDRLLELVHVSRFLERLADHATNIGEWVVYGETAGHVSLNP